MFAVVVLYFFDEWIGASHYFILQAQRPQATSIPCVHACQVTSVVSDSLSPYGLQPARFLCPWDSLGKNTGVGCHALLQGIFLTQGSNPSLLCLLQGGKTHMVSTLTEVVSFENTFYRTRKAKRYKGKKRGRRWDCFSVTISNFTEVTG